MSCILFKRLVFNVLWRKSFESLKATTAFEAGFSLRANALDSARYAPLPNLAVDLILLAANPRFMILLATAFSVAWNSDFA